MPLRCMIGSGGLITDSIARTIAKQSFIEKSQFSAIFRIFQANAGRRRSAARTAFRNADWRNRWPFASPVTNRRSRRICVIALSRLSSWNHSSIRSRSPLWVRTFLSPPATRKGVPHRSASGPLELPVIESGAGGVRWLRAEGRRLFHVVL